MWQDKKIITSIFIIISLILVISFYSIWRSMTFGTLKIESVPPESILVLNKKKYKLPATIPLREGKYKAKIIKENYLEKPITFTIDRKKEKKLSFSLEISDNISLENELKMSEEERMKYEAKVNKKTEEEETRFLEENKLTKYLPFESTNFRIDYGADELNSFKSFYLITLMGYPNLKDQYKKEALDYIRGKSINPDSLDIRFEFEETKEEEL